MRWRELLKAISSHQIAYGKRHLAMDVKLDEILHRLAGGAVDATPQHNGEHQRSTELDDKLKSLIIECEGLREQRITAHQRIHDLQDTIVKRDDTIFALQFRLHQTEQTYLILQSEFNLRNIKPSATDSEVADATRFTSRR